MLVSLLILVVASSQQQPVNALTSEEKAAGFELLFDGTSLSNFKGYGREGVPDGWTAREGELTLTPGRQGGDLSTVEKYKDFDLRVDFKISKGGNSGIKILVSEEDGDEGPIGPEYQIFDDDATVLTAKHRTGANYDMQAPTRDMHRPAGQWNEARIVKKGNYVEHWLNGVRIVEYELYSDDWKKMRAASKYDELPSYAREAGGFICFQDHGDRVWFRTVRIRRL